MTTEFPTRFDFKTREGAIYQLWLDRDVFTANADSSREPFVIVIPPPNVTGALHMGHALNNTIQDLLIRWRRMEGREALWLPGTDHAGIATQFVVEKQLKVEGSDRHKLGREKFLERVWAWKKEYGDRILYQLRRFGASCDWTRTRFTMDDAYCRAVRTAFVAFFKKGWIYRGPRVVNWCPTCGTVLSDLEVVKQTVKGKLWHVKYAVKGSADFVTVATTRPETILGDTAVAVNPKDERYAKLVGKTCILPVLGREIPVVADAMVDMAFGTGAVKVTPAHDFDDFECGARHKLPAISVMDEAARMNGEAGPFKGMDRFECRRKILEALGDKLVKEEDCDVTLSHCYRCDAVLEPRLSEQWFVKMGPMAAAAAQAVRDGTVKFRPDRWGKPYLDWLDNIRDWCISRQLWWGHRIPVWYCACGTFVSAVDDPKECPKCRSTSLRQDPDVLDTWFSSALWPFATLGWPDLTPDFEKFYPGHVLVTGRDIINLWVSRMVMEGLEFCGDRPFDDVIIHATIMDDVGQRQSKSKGTGLDPLDLVDEFGADALRFGLAWVSTGVQDIRFGKDLSSRQLEQGRNFATKIWNATRFAATGFEGPPDPHGILAAGRAGAPPALPADLRDEDRWILSAVNTTINAVEDAWGRYDFGEAAQRVFKFAWNEFCDWYIELAKRRLEEPAARATLGYVIDRLLRVLHPVMPYVTEELWQALRGRGWQLEATLAKAAWPAVEPKRIDAELEARMDLAFDVVRRVREVRARSGIARAEPLEAHVAPRDDAAASAVKASADMIRFMAGLSDLRVSEARPAGSVAEVADRFTLYVPLKGKIDAAKEIAAKRKERDKLSALAASQKAKLDNPRIPEPVRDDMRGRFEETSAQLAALDETLKMLDEIR